MLAIFVRRLLGLLRKHENPAWRGLSPGGIFSSAQTWTGTLALTQALTACLQPTSRATMPGDERTNGCADSHSLPQPGARLPRPPAALTAIAVFGHLYQWQDSDSCMQWGIHILSATSPNYLDARCRVA